MTELMKFAERCIGYLESPVTNRITDVDRKLGDACRTPRKRAQTEATAQ
jgi:hypothetical protein